MGSKAFVVLGVVLAVFLLVSSEVANARDVAKVDSKEDAAGDDGGYGVGAQEGRGGYNRPGHGARPGEVEDAKYGGRRCRYGCCYKGYYGCSRCCSYAGEVPVQSNQDAETHN